MQSDAASVRAYLAELPEDRREIVEAVRAVILEHLPAGFEEGMQYGMIGYHVPLERYPVTYNGRPGVAALASQKRHLSLYLMGIYGDDGEGSWFRERSAAKQQKAGQGEELRALPPPRRPRPRRRRRGDRLDLGGRLHRRLRAQPGTRSRYVKNPA